MLPLLTRATSICRLTQPVARPSHAPHQLLRRAPKLARILARVANGEVMGRRAFRFRLPCLVQVFGLAAAPSDRLMQRPVGGSAAGSRCAI